MVETALMATLKDEASVDAIHSLVLGYDQPAQTPLKLQQRFSRKHALKPWCIVLNELRKFNQR
jgi:hypothetical protein